VVNVTLWPPYPSEESGACCTGQWVDPRVSIEGCENMNPPGFDPWTFQFLASLYTYGFIPAHTPRMQVKIAIALKHSRRFT